MPTFVREESQLNSKNPEYIFSQHTRKFDTTSSKLKDLKVMK
jgi:hypothetical protein